MNSVVGKSTALFLLLILAGSALAQFTFPEKRGAVNDYANVISPQTERTIEQLAIEVFNRTGVAIVICAMESIGDEDYRDYANRLFEHWGIGVKGEDKGVLIFFVSDQRRVWIEVGYGVEYFITDSKAGDVWREVMRPRLRQGDFDGAFLGAVQSIAGYVAEEFHVTFSQQPSPPQRAQTRRSNERGLPFCTFIGLIIILSILTRGRILPWLLLGSIFRNGGFRGGGGFGGGFGGGGFGGGFGGGGGGFGGFGGGMSGGGGAGGSF